MGNIARIEDYIGQAVKQGAQIVVFGEYSVIGWTVGDSSWQRDTILPFLEPIPAPGSHPCSTPTPSTTITHALSCLASQYQVTLVVNYGDVQPCTQSCPRNDSRWQFNTAVAFGPDGTVLAKYHKHHLFGEEWYDAAPAPQLKSSFNTSFGVEFGVFICFDILWESSETLTHFAYPTWWVNSEVPALTAQQSWSQNRDTVLLAANIGASSASSGSAIWYKGKSLASFYNPTSQPAEKLLVATVPIN
eukprot:TRINITY_DN1904_c0_g1_i2.p1 TRINITY_DN1904_c0_g1~~TRINITY_DN1904_c0_g1_i2.p1  ORF type:complete len:246 (-),score=52.33 TRINITY_DN1904_c0_g1_i2:148-885(-)